MSMYRKVLKFAAQSRNIASNQDATSLIETAIILPFLLLMLAGAMDIGRMFRASMIVKASARMGAAYGIHHPTDVAGMITAAKTDTSTLVSIVPLAQYGCECSDGKNAIASCSSEPSCSMNSVYFVEVDTSASYTPILPWPGIPSSIPIRAEVRLRAAR
ncbi:TadE/TadG family type IV pilus assembly protein [Terriglobus sp. RCC_193]|uniref:TadE/TadG family type IV pilus assembly protein n=1 Tax=Terriglobus sp. RCC_193 TaxID=3239218 RepID=UPI003523E268